MSEEGRQTAEAVEGVRSTDELSDRERGVLEAVVRTYVTTAEPAGSRTVARGFDLGVSAATIRNTMSDLEDKGYLTHPHTSAGRVPTDRAYRYFVDRLIQPASLSMRERDLVEQQVVGAATGIEALVQQATRALSMLTRELGVAIAPTLRDAVLEKLELIQASSSKVVMIATVRGGLVRTVYVDLVSEVPQDTLVTLTLILNERLSGLTLQEIRESLPERLRDSGAGEDPSAEELLNIFMQSRDELFDWPAVANSEVHLGQASVLADQPEFTSGEQLKNLIELTERRELFAHVLGQRFDEGGMRITIGGEHANEELSDFTLVTSEYKLGNLRGVIGVIGPTRMPYEKVIAIVDYTSTLVNRILKI